MPTSFTGNTRIHKFCANRNLNNKRELIFMRAETASLVDEIKQAISLLRGYL